MATTSDPAIEAYLAAVPADRRAAIADVRAMILKNLPSGFEEAVQYGMIAYRVPHARYPATYNGQPLTLACLASQKSYMVVYLMSIYGDPALKSWFEEAYRESGKRLDIGKSCVRFRSLDDLPLALVGQAITKVSVESFIAMYEASRAGTKGGLARAKRSAATTKKVAKKTSATKRAGAKVAPKPAKAKARKPTAKKTAPKKQAVRKATRA